MADDIQIQASLRVDSGDSKKRIDEINQSIAEAKKELSQATYGTKEYADAQDKLNKATGDLTKVQKAIGEETKKTSTAFGGLKSIITGLGVISLLEKAFDIFKETLGKNQKVIDFMSTAMGTLSIAFNDLFGYISSHVGDIAKYFKDIFDNPTKALTNFADAIKNNLIERFNSFIKTLGLVGDTVVNLVTGKFAEAAKSAKAAAKESLDVVTGINNTGDKIADIAGKVVDYTKKTVDAAAAQTKLANNSKLAAAELKGLKEQYDRDAEQQRQIRDDQSKSIEERQAANIKLGKILKEQASVMTALADVNIKAARQDLAQNKDNIDLQIKLKDSLTERKAILAQISGLESEQKVNEIGLAKEKLDRDKAIKESENKIFLDRKKAAAELIQDELVKAQTLRVIQDEESKLELKRLQDNINNTKLGTQARVDAEIAFNEKKKDIDIANAQSYLAIDTIKKQREKDLLAARSQNNLDLINLKKTLAQNEVTDEITKSNNLIAIAQQEHDAKIALLESQRDAEIAAAEKAGLDTSAIKEKYNIQIASTDAALVATQKDLSNAIIEAKMTEYSTISGLAGQLSQLVGQQTMAGKLLAVAQTTIDTYVAAFRAYKEGFKIDPTGIFSTISAGIAAATGIASVKKILSVQVPNAGGGGGSSPSAVNAPLAPQRSSTSLDAASIQGVGNAANAGVGKSFVLATDIKDNQEREALLIRSARLH
jgi:hypothetical protein